MTKTIEAARIHANLEAFVREIQEDPSSRCNNGVSLLASVQDELRVADRLLDLFEGCEGSVTTAEAEAALEIFADQEDWYYSKILDAMTEGAEGEDDPADPTVCPIGGAEYESFSVAFMPAVDPGNEQLYAAWDPKEARTGLKEFEEAEEVALGLNEAAFADFRERALAAGKTEEWISEQIDEELLPYFYATAED